MTSPTKNGDNDAEKTDIAYGIENTIKMTIKCFSIVRNKTDVCSDYKGPIIFVETDPVWNSYKNMKDRGVKIRFVTDIRKDNVIYCKKLSEIGEIRHLEGVNGNFGILDGSEYYAPAISQNYAPAVPILIHISIKDFVGQHQYLFNVLWNKAIPAQVRIKEIEEGIMPAVIESFSDPVKIQELYIDMINSATKEIMLIIPTKNGFYRQDDIAVIRLLAEKAITSTIAYNNVYKIDVRNKEIKIRLLSSLHDFIEPSTDNDATLLPSQIQFQNMESTSSIKSTILIVDRKKSLVIEVKDDSKDIFIDSIGFATYSNSRPTVLSYISIFESFWLQNKLYEKVKKSENMQKQFISIASHELRTPIQPILGLVEVLQSKIKDDTQKQLLDVISRNAKKLKQLAEDVLDVAKIESDTLHLNSEGFDLNDLISKIIIDHNTQFHGQGIKLKYDNNSDYSFVTADKHRLSQVISNLLSNAIKFSQGQDRDIFIKMMKNKEDDSLVVSIKDRGAGIHSKIHDRLFTKFATTSFQGTGLGLFTSKSIVEGHGGQIWAENNQDGKGATFSFSIPLSRP